MSTEQTTVAVQRYLNSLAGHQPAEPIVRALLERSVRRLHLVCRNLFYHQYRSLALPPLNLQPHKLFGAVVERLLEVIRTVRAPDGASVLFSLVNQNMRSCAGSSLSWPDAKNSKGSQGSYEDIAPPPACCGSVLAPDDRSMLEAIDRLPAARNGVMNEG